MGETLESFVSDTGYELQPEHLIMFKNEVVYWQNRLGLLNWEINIQFQAPTDEYVGQDVMAWTIWSPESSAAMIGLVPRWLTIQPTEGEVRKAAFHEVCELLFNELRDNLLPNVSADKMVHQLIRRLEASVWLPDYQRRFGA